MKKILTVFMLSFGFYEVGLGEPRENVFQIISFAVAGKEDSVKFHCFYLRQCGQLQRFRSINRHPIHLDDLTLAFDQQHFQNYRTKIDLIEDEVWIAGLTVPVFMFCLQLERYQLPCLLGATFTLGPLLLFKQSSINKFDRVIRNTKLTLDAMDQVQVKQNLYFYRQESSHTLHYLSEKISLLGENSVDSVAEFCPRDNENILRKTFPFHSQSEPMPHLSPRLRRKKLIQKLVKLRQSCLQKDREIGKIIGEET